MKFSLLIVSFHLALVISCVAGASHISDPIIHQLKTWCVVKPGAPDNKLLAFVDTVCTELDCKEIRPGGSCYEPNTPQNHASYVLNLVFRARGVCNADIGATAVNDPSFGRCQYT